jgi:hypothetical protein
MAAPADMRREMLAAKAALERSAKRASDAKTTPTPAPTPAPVEAVTSNAHSAFLALLNVEAEARDARSVRDLILVMANETRKLTRARQVFVMLPGVTGSLDVKGVSSMPVVDRNAPLIAMVESILRPKRAQLDDACQLSFNAVQDAATAKAYPFRHMRWEPLQHGDRPLQGGLVLAREDEWTEADLIVAKRLATTYAHAMHALNAPAPRLTSFVKSSKRWPLVALVAAMCALVFIKVPMTALAPAEIVARDGTVVAAPIDGVIESILVEPNQPVKAGQSLVKLNDTTLRSRFEVAERDVTVGEARLKQSNQMAFSDPRGMHELGIARAELEIKIAERNFAAEMLAKSDIKALKDGVAVYADRRELIGKPVAVGERILEVADPAAVEVRIELPIADAIALAPDATVRVFLDSDPLNARRATIKRADYKAKVGNNDVLAFRVVATLEDIAADDTPRIGVRGTAQVSGDDVALGFFLFRRPITALRQWLGV